MIPASLIILSLVTSFLISIATGTHSLLYTYIEEDPIHVCLKATFKQDSERGRNIMVVVKAS